MKNKSKFKKPLEQRLWDRVDVRGPDDCWEWQGHKHWKSGGQIGLGTRESGLIYTHALAWMIDQGKPIPQGMVICHRCDNPPCCNPDHLFLGTHADNTADMVSKGRHHYGERAGKIKEADVISIRKMHADGMNSYQISKQYPICRTAVDKIIKRKTWKHI